MVADGDQILIVTRNSPIAYKLFPADSMSDNSWSPSEQSASKQMAGQTVHSALWIQRALTYFFGHHSLFEA